MRGVKQRHSILSLVTRLDFLSTRAKLLSSMNNPLFVFIRTLSTETLSISIFINGPVLINYRDISFAYDSPVNILNINLRKKSIVQPSITIETEKDPPRGNYTRN